VMSAAEPLRTDTESDRVCRMSETGNHTIRLVAGLTEHLLKGVNQAYQTEINDVLLAALGKVLSGYQGKETIVFGLEGHGREEVMGREPDLSRTVGWFTNLYPVRLEIGRDAEAGELLRSVKEQLRNIPGKGMGYGVLRRLHPSRPIDVMFNYLGQLDNATAGGGWLKAAGEGTGPTVAGNNTFGHLLSVNAFITGGELVVSWGYDGLRYEEATIKRIAESYIQELEALIAHCRSAGRGYTPSDFGLGGSVRYNELETFLDAGETDVHDIIF